MFHTHIPFVFHQWKKILATGSVVTQTTKKLTPQSKRRTAKCKSNSSIECGRH